MIYSQQTMLKPSDLPAMVIFKALEDAKAERERVKLEAREFLLSDYACWYTSLLGIRRDCYLEWIRSELSE